MKARLFIILQLCFLIVCHGSKSHHSESDYSDSESDYSDSESDYSDSESDYSDSESDYSDSDQRPEPTEFFGTRYQSQTARKKMNQIWAQCIANSTSSTLPDFAGIFNESMKVSFDQDTDVLPPGRLKFIHAIGSVAQAEFIAVKKSPYSGIFQGAKHVLLRISVPRTVNPTRPPRGAFIPSMAVKFLRNHRPSANIVTSVNASRQDSFNMFKYDWSHHIPLTTGAIGAKFAEATSFVSALGLKPLATYTEQGTSVKTKHLKFPFQILFRPTHEVNTLFPDEYTSDLHVQLATLHAGTNLFDVYAVEKPNAAEVKIGTLRMKTTFTTSYFADTKLFFAHNLMEDDLKIYPEWEPALAPFKFVSS